MRLSPSALALALSLAALALIGGGFLYARWMRWRGTPLDPDPLDWEAGIFDDLR